MMSGVTLRHRAALAAVLLPVLASLGACSGSVSVGSGSGYDADKVAAQVQSAQEKVTPDLDVADATCPDKADMKVGSTIACSVTVEGVVAPYTVTFTSVGDDKADFHIAPAKAIMSVDKVVTFLQQQASDQGLGDVDVDCGDAAIIVQDPGTTFSCTLSQGSKSQDVTLLVKDLDGTVTIQS